MGGMERAAGVARHLSRLLREAGFTMADTRDKYRWTEGYHVHRIGYGTVVSVSYHTPGYKDSDKARCKEAMTKAREFLEAKGYELDERGWFETERKAS